MRIVESISLGSSYFPREDRHLAALTKQRQTSIEEKMREFGRQEHRIRLLERESQRVWQRWEKLENGLLAIKWNGSRYISSLSSQTDSLVTLLQYLCYLPLRSFFP